ncbi:DUF4238 domain-containing protein [Pandoraea bronchicola]|uniref:DUF4238 domain-containing protein n=1 Tax=Pandoraea bronchicola TaxID=2508287 RepID=A0A5E5BN32_9BURK|nr:DUF4238 domain-containing protein [Pandoraea bronchicola]VVE87671.1 hypothetical protein PBR20603_01608 [Pandoraea bronchicola]
MTDQQTRNNHYVPQWYQRGFLAPGQSRLFHLNLAPDRKTLPDGRQVPRTALHEWGTKNCFVEYDLYTTHFGPIINDDVERYLFGVIDDQGAKAVRAFSLGNHADVHESFQDFFEHMAAQKLRTPKGLDWIRSCYGALGQVDLMVEMQALRLMHCTMWVEGVREIVSAQDSDVKFILTDHPVTIYNAAVDPTSEQCAYPQDPLVAALGSQTVFALDANTCLILTHLEYAKEPDQLGLTRLRTNARHLGVGMTRTDNFIRDRRLSRDEVIAINHLLKSRAKRYIAGADKTWLYPEREFNGSWAQIANVLRPKTDLWRFGGETYVGYKDGSSGYWDEYGRTSKAHEFLTRKSPRKNIGANDFCGCGSAYAFRDCCQRLPAAERPSWDVYGLRERNLMFCNAVRGILGLSDGVSWEDVRRNLSDEHVKRIHSAFASLWPEDTDLASLLPRPNPKVLRSVYMGFSDPRTVEAAVLGWLPFVDEIVLVNPFFLGTRIKPEFSPIESPTGHKMQTLKNVMLLLVLEPFIRTGLVHLVPDPGEVSAPLGHHVREVLTRRTLRWTPPKGGGLHRFLKLEEEETRRVIWMLPEASQRRFIAERMPHADAVMTDRVIAYFKRLAEADPYTLLQPLPVGKDAAQYQILKGLSLEAALYVASLTGSIVHVDTEAQWAQLLEHAQPAGAPSQCTWEPVRQALHEISFPVELNSQQVAERIASGNRPPIGSLLRWLAKSVSAPEIGPAPAELAKRMRQARARVERAGKRAGDSVPLPARLELHVPPAGFARHEVQRLLVMFAGVTRPRSIPYALRLVFDEPEDSSGDISDQDDAVGGISGSRAASRR